MVYILMSLVAKYTKKFIVIYNNLKLSFNYDFSDINVTVETIFYDIIKNFNLKDTRFILKLKGYNKQVRRLEHFYIWDDDFVVDYHDPLKVYNVISTISDGNGNIDIDYLTRIKNIFWTLYPIRYDEPSRYNFFFHYKGVRDSRYDYEYTRLLSECGVFIYWVLHPFNTFGYYLTNNTFIDKRKMKILFHRVEFNYNNALVILDAYKDYRKRTKMFYGYLPSKI